MTTAALSDPEPLLLGNLKMKVVGPGDRPVLVCDCHSPLCRSTNSVADWPDGREALTTSLSTKLPCLAGPFSTQTVRVGLEPGRWSENFKVITDHDQALRESRPDVRGSNIRAQSVVAKSPAPVPRPEPEMARVHDEGRVDPGRPAEARASEGRRVGVPNFAALDRIKLLDLIRDHGGLFAGLTPAGPDLGRREELDQASPSMRG
jgi:hypothetical protein